MMEMQTEPSTAPHQRLKLQDVEAQIVDDGDEKTRKERNLQKTLFSRAVQGVAVGCIVLNILAMVFYAGGVVVVAGIVGIVVGGGVIFFQNELQDEDSLRTVQNNLRHSVNDFTDENDKLTGNVNRLESEIAPLKETEAKLEALAVKSGATVEKLRGLIKTNQVTINQMKATLDADVMASMVEIVLQSDKSEEGQFSEQEIQRLILRLKALPTIQMNEERFKEKLVKISDSTRQFAAILKLMEQIEHDNIDEEERVFKLSSNAMDNVLLAP